MPATYKRIFQFKFKAEQKETKGDESDVLEDLRLMEVKRPKSHAVTL